MITFALGVLRRYTQATVCIIVQDPWAILSGVSNAVLALVAVFAYFAATRQLDSSVQARKEAVGIAKAQATTVLLKEFGKDRMEFLFGFFDVAYDIDDSRDACTSLYRDLVVAERNRKRAIGSRHDRIDVLKAEMRKAIEDDIGPEDDDAPITDEDRAREFKNKVIEVANRCERAWVLIEQGAIDPEFFFSDQAYNVASSYYALEHVLADLSKEEHFDFDDFRKIAIAASAFMRDRSKFDQRIANATFPLLPAYDPTRVAAKGNSDNNEVP